MHYRFWGLLDSCLAAYDHIRTDTLIKIASKLNSQNIFIVEALKNISSLKNTLLEKNLWRYYEKSDYFPLKKFCKKITDGTHQKVDRDKAGDIPFLYVSCIGKGEVYWENTDLVTNDTYKLISKGREINENVVLYSAVGSYGNAVHIGKSIKATFQRHIAYLEVNPEFANPKFVEIWINSRFGKFHSERLAIGNAQKTVTLGDLSHFPFPNIPINEQNNTVKLYKIIEGIEKISKIKMKPSLSFERTYLRIFN